MESSRPEINRVDRVELQNTLIPAELLELVRHWSQWINRHQKRVFLIVDSIPAGHCTNETENDIFWILEQGVVNLDGSRKFLKIPAETFIQQIASGALEYFDPATFIKTNLK